MVHAFGEACAAGDHLRFSMLGPVTAWFGTREISLGPPQQRAVLTTLLCQNGSYVSVDELIDAIWSDGLTETAEKTLRTYIYRLRQIFKEHVGDDPPVIVSMNRGYATEVAEPAIDVHAFFSAVEDARQARRAQDLGTVVARAREGLGLWRGREAMTGVPGGFAERVRIRLYEARLSAFEMLLSAQLSLGIVADTATDELAALVAENPLDERFRSLFMIALVRGDRRAEALFTYHDAQRALREGLGIDPGEELRKTYAHILRGDLGSYSASRGP